MIVKRITSDNTRKAFNTLTKILTGNRDRRDLSS